MGLSQIKYNLNLNNVLTPELIQAYLFHDMPVQERNYVQSLLEQDEDAFQTCLELAMASIAYDLSEDEIFSSMNASKAELMAILK